MPRPSKYNEDFRRDAVELVRSSGRTLRDVGRELGVNHETLRGWVSAAKRADERYQDGRALLAALRALEPARSQPPRAGNTGSDSS